jgi:polyphosphate kinase
MPRNFDRRVESFVPIENETVHQQRVNQILATHLRDEAQSWEMQADGTYRRVDKTGQGFACHHFFMTNPSLSGRGSALKQSQPASPVLLDD